MSNYDIFPQVGAILLWNGLRAKCTIEGGQSWVLKGSGTLIDKDLVLTVAHFAPHHPVAVYFPSEGIVKVKNWEFEKKRLGDYLMLLRLEREIGSFAPIPHEKVTKYRGLGEQDPARHAFVWGYGAWKDLPPTQLNGLVGLQRGLKVGLLPDRLNVGDDYDTLDLIWSSRNNGGVSQDRLNSGGPMLWEGSDHGYSLIGVYREKRVDHQIGSWIGKDRDEWLKGKIDRPPVRIKPSRGGLFRQEFGKVTLFRFPVPESLPLRATLNASPGFALQMKIFAGEPPHEDLEQLRSDPKDAGSFLTRELDSLPEGTEEIVVAVGRYVQTDDPSEPVYAQLCMNQNVELIQTAD